VLDLISDLSELPNRKKHQVMFYNSSALTVAILLSVVPYFIHAFFTPAHTITNTLISLNRRVKYSPPGSYHNRSPRILENWCPSGSAFDDFEDFKSSDSSDSSSSNDMYADLRARQTSLSNYGTTLKKGSGNEFSNADNDLFLKHKKRSEEDLESLSNWKNAQCTSTIRLALSDWIRRIAVDSYPLAVCGSADGSIYLADLETGEELDCVRNAHLAQVHDLIRDLDGRCDDTDAEEKKDSLMSEEAMQQLYGMYDGGGVVSISVHKDIVVSSGREGGVRLFTISGEEETSHKGSRGGITRSLKLKLISEGMLRGLDETLVTSMAFDDTGTLWIGGYDGVIRGYEYDNKESPLAKQTRPIFEMDTGSKILNISINNEIGCGVAATSSGKVYLFSAEDGEILSQWNPFGQWNPFDKAIDGRWKREYARSATIVQNDRANSNNDEKDAIWSVVCGGSEGTMYQRRLNVDSMGYVSEKRPFFRNDLPVGRMQPTHSGPVVALTSPSHGLLISGSQDGTIRVWDCSHQLTKDEEELMSLEQEDGTSYDSERGKDRRPRCLYALTGYKAWLGSVFTNENKLVSDGADNTIVVHDFSGKSADGEGFLYEGEEEDEMEGFSFD